MTAEPMQPMTTAEFLEVQSPSTVRIDYGRKMHEYRTIEALYDTVDSPNAK